MNGDMMEPKIDMNRPEVNLSDMQKPKIDMNRPEVNFSDMTEPKIDIYQELEKTAHRGR